MPAPQAEGADAFETLRLMAKEVVARGPRLVDTVATANGHSSGHSNGHSSATTPEVRAPLAAAGARCAWLPPQSMHCWRAIERAAFLSTLAEGVCKAAARRVRGPARGWA